jgi:glyoxylase I family protein
MQIETIHHVSLPVSDLARARDFYVGVLGLEAIARPDFPFDGAWFRVGNSTLHLIVPERTDVPTYRRDKAIDSHDAHFAIRVTSYSGALAYLESKGYRRSGERNPRPTADNPRPMRVNAAGQAGFPQLYILDPDRNVIEINAAAAD